MSSTAPAFCTANTTSAPHFFQPGTSVPVLAAMATPPPLAAAPGAVSGWLSSVKSSDTTPCDRIPTADARGRPVCTRVRRPFCGRTVHAALTVRRIPARAAAAPPASLPLPRRRR
eukprot:scaffold49077_cov36-Phaeocystis_antarctica.AAC.1